MNAWTRSFPGGYCRLVPTPVIAPGARHAILSFHSHGDRSFLDDQLLALASGDLRAEGVDNDLVLVVLDPAAPPGNEVEQRLVQVLRGFDVIIYERVWSRELVSRLRDELPEKLFIWCRGEHRLETPPADWAVSQLRETLPELLAYLRGDRATPPHDTWRREGALFVRPADSSAKRPRELRWHPNLQPLVVNPEALPRLRTFSLTGNGGCAYQADARQNPLYEGVTIPQQYGRGCAFCTTGNSYTNLPNAETAARVTEQIGYVRAQAPELTHIRLKDQNPFGYLTEVCEAVEREHLGPFTFMLETRADWTLRSAKRFERALEHARSAGLKLAPFLVGIENFSQPELDRFNKGTTAAVNEEFLQALWQWKERFPEALDLSEASFGFILYSPWTSMDDLRTNHAAIVRTQLDRLRGSILLARVRLYPDTALFYLAQRDGLLADAFESDEEDSSKRYGYYPYQPWRFLNADVAHFSRVAVEATRKNNGKDQVALFGLILRAFDAAGSDWRSVTADAVLESFRASARKPGQSSGQTGAPRLPSLDPAMKERLGRLLAPLSLDDGFDGWTLRDFSALPGRMVVTFAHAQGEPPLGIELRAGTSGEATVRSRHYGIRSVSTLLTELQARAFARVSEAILRNDR